MAAERINARLQNNGTVMAQIFCPVFVVSWGTEKNSTRTARACQCDSEPKASSRARQFVHTVVVDDLNANVTVQSCGDDSGDDSEHIANRLPCIGGEALVRDLRLEGQSFSSSRVRESWSLAYLVRVLALEEVHI